MIARAYRHLKRARNTRDLLFQHFRGLTEGMKELKLHADRRQAFLTERIDAATEALKHDAMAGIRHHLTADAWSQVLFYGLLGGLVFLAPVASGLSTEAQTGYLLTALYMMTPIWGVMELWPIMARARISLEKVRALGLSLGSPATVPEPGSLPLETQWDRLEFDGVTFAYPPDVDGRAFTLGPIDFVLRQGELVFLVGGNGSGKSTFVKVLTGLYSPRAGRDPPGRPGDRRQGPGRVPRALLGGLLRLLPLRYPARAAGARSRRARAALPDRARARR